MKENLFIWNGTASKQFSGGDNYVIKFIKFSGLKYNLILPEGNESALPKKNLSFFTTKNFKPKNFSSLLWLYIIRLIQAIKIIISQDKEYNLAITSSPFLFDILPIIFAKANKRITILYHVIPKRRAENLNTSFRFAVASIEKRISFYFIKKYFDVIITGNEIEKQKLKKLFPTKKILIAHAGLDTKAIDNCPKQEKDKNLISFVGRLTTQKGIFDIVEIMKHLKKFNPKLKLIITGDGPDRHEFEERIKKANLSSIQLKGFVSEKEKYQILKSSKFFFFPSYEEGWGIALAEALYTENICFCYELPHYSSIFSNYPIYIKKGNTKDFINKFLKHSKNNVSPKQKLFMSQYDDKRVISSIIHQLQNEA